MVAFAELLKGDGKINMKMCATTDMARAWGKIDFRKAADHVKKLQRRIAVAYQHDELDKVASLQHKMIHSFDAKALSVKSVSSNKGKNTPGVDNECWNTPEAKYDAIFKLRRRDYQPLPLKRSYILKANGGYRPLSIPTMRDRAMQTLYKFALEPIGQLMADSCSFAYLPNRGAREAVIRVNDRISARPDFCWMMKADIKSCFDSISQEWLIDNYYQQFFVMDEGKVVPISIISELAAPSSKSKLAQMDVPLVCEYLKNVGYDCFPKPDTHIRRILGRDILGLSASREAPPYQAIEIVSMLAEKVGKSAAEADYILWSYCATRYGEICTSNKPKCSECVVAEQCKMDV